MIDFSKQKKGTRGIVFRHAGTGQEMAVEVFDKFPQMQGVHVEGRRYVEVSVEMFIGLIATQGFRPVVPGEDTLVEENEVDDEE